MIENDWIRDTSKERAWDSDNLLIVLILLQIVNLLMFIFVLCILTKSVLILNRVVTQHSIKGGNSRAMCMHFAFILIMLIKTLVVDGLFFCAYYY